MLWWCSPTQIGGTHSLTLSISGRGRAGPVLSGRFLASNDGRSGSGLFAVVVIAIVVIAVVVIAIVVIAVVVVAVRATAARSPIAALALVPVRLAVPPVTAVVVAVAAVLVVALTVPVPVVVVVPVVEGPPAASKGGRENVFGGAVKEAVVVAVVAVVVVVAIVVIIAVVAVIAILPPFTLLVGVPLAILISPTLAILVVRMPLAVLVGPALTILVAGVPLAVLIGPSLAILVVLVIWPVASVDTGSSNFVGIGIHGASRVDSFIQGSRLNTTLLARVPLAVLVGPALAILVVARVPLTILISPALAVLVVGMPMPILVSPPILVVLVVGPAAGMNTRNTKVGSVITKSLSIEGLRAQRSAFPPAVVGLAFTVVDTVLTISVVLAVVPPLILTVVPLSILVLSILVLANLCFLHIGNEPAVLIVALAVLAIGIPLARLRAGVDRKGHRTEWGDGQQKKAVDQSVAHSQNGCRCHWGKLQ